MQGNSASIYGSFLWPASTGPRYVQGFATTTAFVLLLAITAQVNKFLIRRYPGKRLEESYESGAVSREEKDIESV